MLNSIKLSNFKNFSTHQEVILGSIEDQTRFTVIVGANGSGKTSLVDAIEWCCFSGNSLKGVKKLVNSNLSFDAEMSVEVEYLNFKNK